jgi:hypothetical protein
MISVFGHAIDPCLAPALRRLERALEIAADFPSDRPEDTLKFARAALKSFEAEEARILGERRLHGRPRP